MPGPAGVPRADIIRLLAEGHSDREIGRRLHTNPKRVGRIRTELELPQYEPTTIPLEQKWTTHTQPTPGGHLRWTGPLRAGTPNLVHGGRNYSARRIAFRLGHGREPAGRVLPGCGQSWCIAPDHAEDTAMRRADALYTAIFGAAV
jgi:hypothetical protein